MSTSTCKKLSIEKDSPTLRMVIVKDEELTRKRDKFLKPIERMHGTKLR